VNAIATLPVPHRPPLGTLPHTPAPSPARRHLTIEQEKAYVTAVASEWVTAATAPTPGSRVTAEAGLRSLYAALDLAPPAVLWFPTPCAGTVAAVAVDAESPGYARQACRTGWADAPIPRRSVWPLIAERLWNPAVRDIYEGFGSNQGHVLGIESQIDDVFQDADVDGRWWPALRHVEDVVDTVTDPAANDPTWPDHCLPWSRSLGVDLTSSDPPHTRGRLDCAQAALWDVLHRVGYLDDPVLTAVAMLTRSCLFWWPFEGLAVLTERLDVPGGECPFGVAEP
jgi:hypothetical protein